MGGSGKTVEDKKQKHLQYLEFRDVHQIIFANTILI